MTSPAPHLVIFDPKGQSPSLSGDATLTLRGFYSLYYRRERLIDPRPRTLSDIDSALRLWERESGDPPLSEITSEVLADYLHRLAELDYAPATINKHRRWLLAILRYAGPKADRHWDARGILPQVPWTRAWPSPTHLPRSMSEESLARLLSACSAARQPRNDGIEAAQWWRLLLWLVAETGLRINAARLIRQADIDWQGGWLLARSGSAKTRREQLFKLQSDLLTALGRLRRDGQWLFAWPGIDPESEAARRRFYGKWNRIQQAAGIPRSQWRDAGWQALRRMRGSLVARYFGPQAAQIAMGHTTIATTLRHYLDHQLLEAIADGVPRTKGFADYF